MRNYSTWMRRKLTENIEWGTDCGRIEPGHMENLANDNFFVIVLSGIQFNNTDGQRYVLFSRVFHQQFARMSDILLRHIPENMADRGRRAPHYATQVDFCVLTNSDRRLVCQSVTVELNVRLFGYVLGFDKKISLLIEFKNQNKW